MQLSLWPFGGTGKVSGHFGGQKRELNRTPQPLALSDESWWALWVEILLWTNCLQTVCSSSASSLTEAVVASMPNRNRKVFSFPLALNYIVSKLLLLGVGTSNILQQRFSDFSGMCSFPKRPFPNKSVSWKKIAFSPTFHRSLSRNPQALWPQIESHWFIAKLSF